MAENVAIAKAREQALMKKMQARQRRLQEQAARRFSSTVGMTEEEQERRHMYIRILEYEQQTKWPCVWRDRLALHSSSIQLIQDLIRKILSADDHPITQIMLTYQRRLKRRIEPLVQKHTKDLEELKVPFTKNRKKTSLKSDQKSDRDNEGIGASGHIDSDNTTPSYAETEEINQDFRTSFKQSKDDVAQAIQGGEKIQEKLKADMKGAATFPMPDTSYLDDLDDLYGADTEFEILQSPGCFSPGDDASCEEAIDWEALSVMTEEALRRHIRITTKDVKDYLEKIQAMFIIAYEQLDTYEGRDMCYSCLEEPFFKPLWPLLLVLFRLANKEKEEDIAVSMTQHASCTPQHLNIPGPLCLEADFPTPYSFPYQLAVKELQRIQMLICPLAKLQCIVQVSKLICHCVAEHYKESGQAESAPPLGADDLLPIFSYVLIKSATPQIVSECHAMEEFIHEGYLMGEEGYCLTSLQTCLGYVISLSKESLD